MASTLRAHGPPPAIRALVDSGSHMCDPYGARVLVSASHHANTERLRTGLLRSYMRRSWKQRLPLSGAEAPTA